jgi:hypothetical protein
MPFALDSNPTPGELSDAVNYLLNNFVSSAAVDPVTGEISSGGVIVGYLYKYIAVKYADSFDGTLNFSDTPTNRLYYGIRNSDSAAESSNPSDYYWQQATGGFGVTKFLWYQTTGGRQIQFAVSASAPDVGWLQEPLGSIDLDVVTSGNIPVIAEQFFSYFTPSVLFVPRSGDPLTPVFTNVIPAVFAVDKGTVVPFVNSQTDTAVNFVAGTWRIGNSSTTGYGDISYNNITIGDPTDAGDFAEWPAPTAMPASPAYIEVPIRYKNDLGIVTQASIASLQLLYADPGADGLDGPIVDISGYVSFVQNPAGAFTPPSSVLSALVVNVNSPTYSWAISGATPTTSTASSVSITPTSVSTGVTVTLTVNGTNLVAPVSRTMILPIVYDGEPGQAGSNGVMSAFPSIYLWTGSSVPPTRPSTTSTYTWSTGAYTAPSGWSTSPPSNTVAGNYLWEITIPLNTSATTVTSTLDWTNTSYTIRAIAYNGANGVNGTDGTDGTNGTNGAATFVVTRTANDSSPPTDLEVSALLGRTPVAGDICTVNYNAGNNSVVYRYVTAWTLFQTYITGSLIVQNTITGDKVAANTITADKLSVTQLSAITANLGTVTAGTLSAGTVFAGALSAATGNFSGSLTAATGTFSGTLTADAINAVNTINLAGNAVTIPVSGSGSGSSATASIFLSATTPIEITALFNNSYVSIANFYIYRNGVLIQSAQASGQGFDYYMPVVIVALDNPGAGTHTYTLGYNSSGYQAISNSVITLLAVKR